MAWEHEVKAQPIRLLDVFVVGPLMIYGGRALQPKEELAGKGLVALGLLTIVYNGMNWLRVRQERKR